MKEVFITGGTGYIGGRLIRRLIECGYRVRALVRKGSENKLPEGCDFIIADPFTAESFTDKIPQGAVFIQLLGVPHPGPRKQEQFRNVDLRSAKASARAAQIAGVSHFVYVSVAQFPTRIMKAYQECRLEAEKYISLQKIPATFIRPWYVTGPGHYWPLALLPLFKIMEWIPATAPKAKALGLVTVGQMIDTLTTVVGSDPPEGIRVLEIADIRKTGRSALQPGERLLSY